MLYSGLILTFLGVLPNYSYFVTFFAIPFVFGNIFIDVLSIAVLYNAYFLILSAILLALMPMNVTLVVFWEIILIPLEVLSPLTFVAGVVLLYLSLSNYSQI